MTLVVPGVEVKVVKEVVAPQLSPSGVLGLVGLTEKPVPGLTVVQSWSRFIEILGAASAFSLPEAAAALANGVSELVISPVSASDSTATPASIKVDGLKADGSADASAFTVTARAPGPWANGLTVTIAQRTPLTGAKVFDLTVKRGDTVLEATRNLIMVATKDAKAADAVIADRSQMISLTLGTGAWPKDGDYTLAGGKDASTAGLHAALVALEDDADVDMVLVALQDMSDQKIVAQVYSDVISHCERMSAASKGRIGFGQVPTTGTVAAWTDLVSNLVSDRFVLLAPNGVAASVAGMIGGLDYFQSPTFKTLTGLTDLSKSLVTEDQITLLNAHIVPVVTQRGRGTIVLRGLTTDGDQISVRRVADRAVRGVKLIGELFIGRLNNDVGRGALKQKLTEFLVQMERDGAIVPSTDGKQPSFTLDVYSSQDDFSKGIVRIDLAVRPVRAIDFIYATVLVQS